MGDYGRAVALLEEGLALYREVRDTLGISMCLTTMGLTETARGNHARAMRLTRENLRLARGSDDKTSIQFSLVTLAVVALGLGNPARAARLWGAAETMRESFGIHLTPLTRSLVNYEGLLTAAWAELGEAAFNAAWTEGKAMTQDEAVEYALADEVKAPLGPWDPAFAAPRPDVLTRREEEIAALVACGLTNRRVAEELSISERTVATHVSRILKKLGVRSRDEVAAQASEHRQQWGIQVAR